ncbi:MAG: hypothetical protein JW840_08295 [Candidatus Thermoplasmatota archaeon]|nr:hypothetical protein [Candidatus Thermoplasmatota archaeon]
MKRKTIIITCIVIGLVGIAGTAMATSMGPAPNAGDGVPDGSGFDSPIGPNASPDSGNGHQGPAPNSGDGIPDGPGW